MNMPCIDTFDLERERWGVTSRSKRVWETDFSKGWRTKRVGARPQLAAPKPSLAYTKRSSHLAHLRSESALLAHSDMDGISEPTELAYRSAEAFINGLWDSCLDFFLELSHDGEINFLYGNEVDLFHVHIDEAGVLSYYSRLDGVEEFGDEVSPQRFPNSGLHSFVERLK